MQSADRLQPSPVGPLDREVEGRSHLDGVGLLDRHRCDHAAEAHGAKDRHDFPVTAKR
jgi:hypothetical protein